MFKLHNDTFQKNKRDAVYKDLAALIANQV